MARVDYDTEGLDPPILTVEEAVEKSSFIDIPPFLKPQEVGDFSKGMAEADHQILSAEVLVVNLLLFLCTWQNFNLFHQLSKHFSSYLVMVAIR